MKVSSFCFFKGSEREVLVYANGSKRLNVFRPFGKVCYITMGRPFIDFSKMVGFPADEQELVYLEKELASKVKELAKEIRYEKPLSIFENFRDKKSLTPPQKEAIGNFLTSLHSANSPRDIISAFNGLYYPLNHQLPDALNLSERIKALYVWNEEELKEEVVKGWLESLAFNEIDSQYFVTEYTNEEFEKLLEELPAFMEVLKDGALMKIPEKRAGAEVPYLLLSPGGRAWFKPFDHYEKFSVGLNRGQKRECNNEFFQLIGRHSDDQYKPISIESYNQLVKGFIKEALGFFFA